VIPVSDADRSDARDLIQSRGQPTNRPCAPDFDSECYNPLCWQVAKRGLVDFLGMILPSCAAALACLGARLTSSAQRLALDLNPAHRKFLTVVQTARISLKAPRRAS
jgi:hypothetical protein